MNDGLMESFPINTAAQFKTLLPHSFNLMYVDWEVALTEIMYSVDIKNISTKEAYFDVFVPDIHGREVTDPNLYGWDRFTRQIIDMTPLYEYSSLIPWGSHYIAQGGILLPVNIYRIRFRAGVYTKPMALIKEIDEGLERTLKQVWKKQGNPREISNMTLITIA
jgi:hypothetical protein